MSTVWLMGDEETSEELANLLGTKTISSRVIKPGESLDLLRAAARLEETPPDLIVTSWRGGPAIGDDLTKPPPPGEAIVDEVRSLDLRVPVIIFTGDPTVRLRKFPGVDVTVLEKPLPANEVLAAIRQRLQPSQSIG